MNANYLTKGLGRQLFDANCQRPQGWWHVARLMIKLLRVYNSCMEESKSVQHTRIEVAGPGRAIYSSAIRAKQFISKPQIYIYI